MSTARHFSKVAVLPTHWLVFVICLCRPVGKVFLTSHKVHALPGTGYLLGHS